MTEPTPALPDATVLAGERERWLRMFIEATRQATSYAAADYLRDQFAAISAKPVRVDVETVARAIMRVNRDGEEYPSMCDPSPYEMAMARAAIASLSPEETR